MKKIAILISVPMILFSLFGCVTGEQSVTFTTPDHAYLVPGEDTLDFTTSYDTNAYISKVVCADEATLDSNGPALMSAYAKPLEPSTASVFNLDLSNLSKFDGQLCDVYVTVYDDSTIEELEVSWRVNVGAEPATETPADTCEDGTVCPESTGDVATDDTTATEGVIIEEAADAETTEEVTE